MSYHFYDMGFKDGYKKAIQESRILNESTGPFRYPPNWTPGLNDPITRDMVRFLRRTMHSIPLNVFGARQMAQFLYFQVRLNGMTMQQAQSVVTFLRTNSQTLGLGGGIISWGMVSGLLRTPWVLGFEALAIPEISVTLSGAMAAALGAVLALTAGTIFATMYSDEISTWIADNILGYDMEDLGYYIPKKEIHPTQVKAHDPNKPKIDPQGGPQMLKFIQ